MENEDMNKKRKIMFSLLFSSLKRGKGREEGKK
jgi:hypothetical protein